MHLTPGGEQGHHPAFLLGRPPPEDCGVVAEDEFTEVGLERGSGKNVMTASAEHFAKIPSERGGGRQRVSLSQRFATLLKS